MSNVYESSLKIEGWYNLSYYCCYLILGVVLFGKSEVLI